MGGQSKMMPPSTLSDWPVMFRAASEARKTARSASSSGSPRAGYITGTVSPVDGGLRRYQY